MESTLSNYYQNHSKMPFNSETYEKANTFNKLNHSNLQFNPSNQIKNEQKTQLKPTFGLNCSIQSNNQFLFKRETPKLNLIHIPKLSTPSSTLVNQSTNIIQSTNSVQPTIIQSNYQLNTFQNSSLDKNSSCFVKNKSKLQRPLSINYSSIIQPQVINHSIPTQSSSFKSSSTMASKEQIVNNSKNNLNKKTDPLTNFPSKSNSFRSSNKINGLNSSQEQDESLKTKTIAYNSKQNLSKSNLNLNSTSNLNKSFSNLNSIPTSNLSVINKQTNFKSNLPKSLSGSSTQLDFKRSLVKPKNSSNLPAFKSRPNSVYLSEQSKNKKISKTSSNQNLSENSLNSSSTKLSNLANKNLKENSFVAKKKIVSSNCTKTIGQSSNTLTFRPLSSLSNTNKVIQQPKAQMKDIKNINLDEEKSITKKNKTLLNNPKKISSDKCNIARVSPIRRQFTLHTNKKRNINGSLNSSDQENDEDDVYDGSFENEDSLSQLDNNLNQSSDETSNFDSESAKYFAVLSSSEDETNHLISSEGPRRSKERQNRRLRRASGQRSSCNKLNSNDSSENKYSFSSDQNSNENHIENKENNDSSLLVSDSEKIENNFSLKEEDYLKEKNLIKPTSLNTAFLFPTLNRLHNFNSVQRLNTINCDSKTDFTLNKIDDSDKKKNLFSLDDLDYQSDDTELTLCKLKSLDFNCDTSSSLKNSSKICKKENFIEIEDIKKTDGNNNNLNFNNSNDSFKQTLDSNDSDSLAPSNLNNLFFMKNSVGSLSGSLNGLNQNFNFNKHKVSSITPPPESKTLSNLNYQVNSQQLSMNENKFYQSLVTTVPTPSSFQQNQYSLINSPQLSNNAPASFSSRLSKCGENRGSSLSLISACSSNYSNSLSLTKQKSYQPSLQNVKLSNNFLEKNYSTEIKQLKYELCRANEKISSLKNQLITSGQMVNSFEQSLQSKTTRLQQYALQLEEKDREIARLQSVIDNIYKNSTIDSNIINFCSSSPNSKPIENNNQNTSSDGECVSLKSKNVNKIKISKKRSNSTCKYRTNSITANSSDEENFSLTSTLSKEGNLTNTSSGWFKGSFTRAFKKRNNRSKNGSNQELDKIDSLDFKHPQHPSQLHQSYVQQNIFRQEKNIENAENENDKNELIKLKEQLSEKDKILTDLRLKTLTKENEIENLKEDLNCLRDQVLSFQKQAN